MAPASANLVWICQACVSTFRSHSHASQRYDYEVMCLVPGTLHDGHRGGSSRGIYNGIDAQAPMQKTIMIIGLEPYLLILLNELRLSRGHITVCKEGWLAVPFIGCIPGLADAWLQWC